MITDLPTSSRNLKVVKFSGLSKGLSNLTRDMVRGARGSQPLNHQTSKNSTTLTTKKPTIKPRHLTVRFSGYNKLKLPILLFCRDEYRSLVEITAALPDSNIRNIASKLSGLVNDYARPYLRIKKVDRRTHLYKCTKKGMRIGCELFRRKMLGMDLHITKDRVTHCSRAGCKKCVYNPKGNQTHSIINEV